MKNDNSHIFLSAIMIVAVLLLWSPSIAQGPPNTDQSDRLERELERTDQTLERIADAVAQANVPLAELALEQARELQAQAWEAFRNNHPILASALTKQARERGRVALSLSRQVEQYEGAVVRRLERASDMLDRVAEKLDRSDRQVLRDLYESARNNLVRAWEFYRSEQYKPALKLADQVEQTARKLMQAAGQGGRDDAVYQRRRDVVSDFVGSAHVITSGCESAEAERQITHARRMLELADNLNEQGQAGQALESLKRAREAAMNAVRECQGADQLERRYQRLLGETERLAEQAGNNRDATRMLQQSREQLRIAREHMNNANPEAAAAALQAAQLTIQQARRILGIIN